MISFYDTSTLPTDEMLEAIRRATLGDDVYREDPTVNTLEAMAAELLGKEASILMPSGTMANLVAIIVHARHGDEVVLERESHIVYYETGGVAAIAGCMPLLVNGERGVLRAELVEARLRKRNDHYPPTSLICIENTHNRAGGTITRPEIMQELRELADRRTLAIHVDGARLFNAAVALSIPVRELTENADSVSVCLSKGLGAPVGSLLAGSSDFVARARHIRKMLGGGMRQAGIIAAAGIVALQQGIDRLHEDHASARLLARELAAIPGVQVDPDVVETNIVLASTAPAGLKTDRLVERLRADYDIRASARPPHVVRFVTHRGIGKSEIGALVAAIREILDDAEL